MTDDRSSAVLFCRVCLSALFLSSGFDKIFQIAGFAGAMAKAGMPLPDLFPYLAIFIEIGGGLAILFGLLTRTTAILFAIYVLVATLINHHFWDMPMPAAALNKVQAGKNLAIIGGFVLLAMAGPGRFSLDAMLRRRTAVPA